MSDGDNAQAKKEEMERRKAEVRKRLEESGKAGKKAKKGFLTPDRKKKLRKLLMVKAAEELKNQQLLKEQERQKILAQRTIPCPSVDDVNDQGQLIKIWESLFDVVKRLEEEKFDLNQFVLCKEKEINELTIAVNDLRGKYVKPTLKKVAKYDNKFKKMAGGEGGEAAPKKADFRTNLKTVKKENVLEALDKKKKDDKPDWKAQKHEKKEEEEKPEEKVEEKAPEPEAAPAAEPEDAEEEGEEEEGEEEEEE